MRSTYFADEKSKETGAFLVEPGLETLDSRGFLGFAAVLFVIYAMTPRPVLYAALIKWISEVF